MNIVVPFDGSELSVLALRRGAAMSEAFGAEIHAITVIPKDARFAEDRGWIGPDEPFDSDRIGRQLRDSLDEAAPGASYTVQHVASRLPRGTIAKRLREFAEDVDADVVFIGSENAGRIVAPISSVGGAVATDEEYDVYIVRRRAEYLAETD